MKNIIITIIALLAYNVSGDKISVDGKTVYCSSGKLDRFYLMEYAYFEGQKDYAEGKIKIGECENGYNWIGSPWNNNVLPTYSPVSLGQKPSYASFRKMNQPIGYITQEDISNPIKYNEKDYDQYTLQEFLMKYPKTIIKNHNKQLTKFHWGDWYDHGILYLKNEHGESEIYIQSDLNKTYVIPNTGVLLKAVHRKGLLEFHKFLVKKKIIKPEIKKPIKPKSIKPKPERRYKMFSIWTWVLIIIVMLIVAKLVHHNKITLKNFFRPIKKSAKIIKKEYDEA